MEQPKGREAKPPSTNLIMHVDVLFHFAFWADAGNGGGGDSIICQRKSVLPPAPRPHEMPVTGFIVVRYLPT